MGRSPDQRALKRSLLPGVFVLVLWPIALNAAEPAPPPNAADSPQPQAEVRHPVLEKRNVDYYTGKDADPLKHRLDLFLPRDVDKFPAVVFVHGGAWLIGDKSDFGIYESIGRMFATHGIGMVSINYRLSPQVTHPEHVKDVARAVAWTHKHIAEYGGDPGKLFVCGHSAGGHLSALLATDENYLKAEGLSLANLRGAMPISGAYRVPPDGLFKEVFGTDRNVRRLASPIEHVSANCPPFLISYADRDFPTCDLVSEEFCKALKAQGVSAETLSVKPRNHLDIIGKAARDNDPLARAMRAFVLKYADAKRPNSSGAGE